MSEHVYPLTDQEQAALALSDAQKVACFDWLVRDSPYLEDSFSGYSNDRFAGVVLDLISHGVVTPLLHVPEQD